jgi:hypothetical protein
MRCKFEKQLELISTEKSLSKRREMTIALAPLLQEYQATYLEIGRTHRAVDDDVLGARADLIWQEMMEEVGEAAEWPRDGGDFWVKMVKAMMSYLRMMRRCDRRLGGRTGAAFCRTYLVISASGIAFRTRSAGTPPLRAIPTPSACAFGRDFGLDARLAPFGGYC